MKPVYRLIIYPALILSIAALSLAVHARDEADEINREAHAAINAHRYAIMYGNLPYVTADYWRDRNGMNGALTWDSKENRWRGSFHSPLYNVDDGWRTVTNTPPDWTNTVWMYGDSTVRDDQVPDTLTKASYLQRLFSAYGSRYRVVNRADDGYELSWNVDTLKASDVKPGDIIVFYNGDHDGTAADFKTQVLAAQQFARSRGATFYEFVEEYIWSAPVSEDEQTILSTWPDPDQERKSRAEWAILEPAARGLFASGVAGADLTHVLDNVRRQGVIVNEDFIHTNYIGNAVIAQAIFDAISVF